MKRIFWTFVLLVIAVSTYNALPSIQAIKSQTQPSAVKVAPLPTAQPPVLTPTAELPGRSLIPNSCDPTRAEVKAAGGLNLRARPDPDSRVVRVLPDRQAVTLNGRNLSGEWILVGLPDGERGWVHSAYLQAWMDLEGLPVMDASLGDLASQS